MLVLTYTCCSSILWLTGLLSVLGSPGYHSSASRHCTSFVCSASTGLLPAEGAARIAANTSPTVVIAIARRQQGQLLADLLL